MIMSARYAQCWSVLVLLCWIPALVHAGSGYDPVANFCRRVGHTSTFKHQKVYLNGGLETFADYGVSGQINTNTITSGFNLNLLSINMTADWGGQIAIPINQDPKHKSGAVSGYTTPPNFEYGALYSGPANSTKLYSFGGTTSGYNTSFHDFFIAPDTSYPLWTYDSKTNLWTPVGTLAQGITIPSRGADTEAPDLGLGFYVGGQIDNGTANTTSSLTTPIPLSGMIVIDTIGGDVWNTTVPAAAISSRQSGAAIYTNDFGTSGVVLAMGGQSGGQLLSMSQIAVLDVSTLDKNQATVNSDSVNTWYTVNATGDVPSPRTDFCTISTSAQDGSSTNIYLYGGKSSSEIFDDVYVLSLPSFTWTNVYSGTSGRWGMTCELVSPRQMLVVGGMDSINNNTDNCDWLTQGLGTLDLSTVTGRQGWNSSAYQYSVPAYEVPVDVVAVIGGNVNGSATKMAPANGWSTPALSALFAVKVVNPSATSSSSTGTSTSTSTGDSGGSTDSSTTTANSLTTGAKVGIAVGAVVFAIVATLLTFLMLRRSKRRQLVRTALEVAVTTRYELPNKDRYQLDDDRSASSKVELTANERQRGLEKDSVVIHEAPWERSGKGQSIGNSVEHGSDGPIELA